MRVVQYRVIFTVYHTVTEYQSSFIIIINCCVVTVNKVQPWFGVEGSH